MECNGLYGARADRECVRSLVTGRGWSYQGASFVAAQSTKKASSANPTVLAMDHPITLLMLVLALISLGGLAYEQMRVDIFPSLNTPKISMTRH